ncbi:MAG TPA: acVLRF1 family peptidyl-tRNA hydrolase [Marmoricola sp.]|nr:acVLRF1 family peptidyl-tRNA hydrolase [Marmoricola sp.]
MSSVLVPAGRLARWIENFTDRHGGCALAVDGGRLTGRAPDGSHFAAALPFDRSYDGPPAPGPFIEAAACPADWGLLLVRKGGFGIGRLHGARLVDSKIGQRHVQGRTKAGGQSQQRFARRRDNQARAAYEAAADHASRLLVGAPVLVCGGDRAAVDAVLGDPRLRRLAAVTVEPWLAVPDPRRAVLERAVVDAGSVRMAVTNA